MPKETRRVTFSHAEIHLAMCEYAQRLGKALPAGRLESLAFNPKLDPSLVLVRKLDTGETLPATFRSQEVGAALILFCQTHHIPLPRKGRKGLDKDSDTACLSIAHDWRYAASTHALLIDDRKGLKPVVHRLLKQSQFTEISEADGPEAALKLLAKGACRPDVILCDHDMDGMNGIEFARRLRTGQAHPSVTTPILLFTDDSRVTQNVAWKEAGISHILAKPLVAQELLEAIMGVAHHAQPPVQLKSAG
jgi:two-component system chemotaxis response regulator CheY